MVDADSRAVAIVAEIAQEFGVPVLLHFQFDRYNTSFERFHAHPRKVSDGELHRPRADLVGEHRREGRPEGALSERPGHARRPHRQIARRLSEHVRRPQRRLRPQRAAARRRPHPRLSRAASGQADLTAAIATTRSAKARSAAALKMLATIRRLAPNKAVERKMLFENAKRVLKLKV